MKKINKKKQILRGLGTLSVGVATLAGSVAGIDTIEAGRREGETGAQIDNVLHANGILEASVDPVISNYEVFNVRPEDPSASINYEQQQQFIPWVDNGFDWQQFLQDAGVANTILNQILDSKSQVVNLGFITSLDPKAISSSVSPVVTAFKTWADLHPNNVIPTIGGIIPLWMTNWTDSWGAATPDKIESGSKFYQFLSAIRAAGKDYIYSFGGWNHDSLAMDAYNKGYSAEQLKDLYGAIIRSLNLKAIDFDNEGTENGDTDDFGNTNSTAAGLQAKILRMNAIRQLKKDPLYKDIHIKFTIPSFITKLRDNDRIQIINGFKENLIDSVNIMAFDFAHLPVGSRTTLPGEAAINAISATNAVAKLLADNGIADPYSKIGVTGMVGVQDTKREIWTITDQQLFTNFAINKKIRNFYFWESYYDMEQQIYAANGGALREGHTFGLWTYDQMLQGTGIKDAYASGLNVKDMTFTNIAKRLNTGELYDFAGNINISPIVWKAIKDLGISEVGNPDNITNADIEALQNSDFIFADDNGFGVNLATSDQAKAALSAELNWADWSGMYLSKW